MLASSNAKSPVVNSRTIKTRDFRELCAQHGLAATHQRQVLYEVLQKMRGHPTPEEVYGRTKKRIPAISLATVYKNIHLFMETGVLKQLSIHHGSLRVELNNLPHHHLVCSQCKTITDIEARDLGPLPALQGLPGDFLVQGYSMDVIGICAACQKARRG